MVRVPSLRSRLLWLAVASVVPLLVLAWVLAAGLVQHERDALRRAAQDRNRTFLSAVEEHVLGNVSTLEALGASGALERGDLAVFEREARRVLASQGEWRNVMLVDANGRHRMNLRYPPGAAELPTAPPAEQVLIRRTIETWQPTVGQMSTGTSTAGRWGVPVRIPVRAAGEALVLQFILAPESLLRLMQVQEFPGEWAFAVIDANGVIVVRHPAVAPGQKAAPGLLEAVSSAPEGWVRTPTLEGRDTFQAFRRSPLTGWAVAIAIPAGEVNAVAWRAAGWLAAVAAGSLLLALGLAAWLARRISRPIAGVADAARLLGQVPLRESLGPVGEQAAVAEVQQLAAALRDAEGALAEREQLREREQQALRAADKAKDEFLAMLGHELRNPLAAITASAHVLRLSRPDAAAAQKAHEVIDRQARQMARLVEDLMDISRLAMGKVTLHLEPLDLAGLADRAAHAWQQASAGRAGRVQLSLKPAWVQGDRSRLEQVVANLLDNAHKFSAGAAPVRLRVQAQDGHAVLEVEDEGQGIRPEDLPRIFELFVQGPQPFDRPQGGIGLGLTLVRRLVELQGGTVSAHSEGAGRGARFTIRLPLVEPPSGAAPGGQPASAAPGHRRVLLVEDNEDGRAMMATLLELEGHTVQAAATGLQGVQLAAEWRPDVVLVDIGLPDIDGYEVARRIRRLPWPEPPRLVAVSGFGQPQDQQAAYEAGFDLHLTKPVAPEFLRDVLRALASRQAA